MKNIFYISVILICFSACKRTQHEFDEVSIDNELLDTLYSIEYCHRPMIPTDNYLGLGDTSSNKYKEYDKFYRKRMMEFYLELDSLNLILFTKDLLTELDLESDKDFLLQNLGKSDSAFLELVGTRKYIPPQKLDLTSLKQKNIKFSNFYDLDSTFRCEYGRHGDDFLIGCISASRILVDKESKSGVFSFSYSGSCDCGYGSYYFIRKNEKNEWKVIKRITSAWLSLF